MPKQPPYPKVSVPTTPHSYNPDEMNRPLKILISGGGTGGHIFPALSIANAVRRRHPDAKILFVGAEGRMEMERVPAAGYEIVGLPVAGFDRKRLWRNIPVLYRLWVSMRRARKVLDDFRPDIAVGVGGYASGPVLKEAQKRGIPTLLQEQNSYAGVTNRLLGSKAKAVCVAYEGMDRFFPSDKIILTGNPVRANLLENRMSREEAKKALGFDPEKPLVAVVGGSLGALTVNRSVAAALDHISDAGASLLWQTGKIYYDEYAPKATGRKNVRTMPFISDMDLVYRAADLMVCRAGAATISELQLLRVPAILIPSPNVAENHQFHNANALAQRGAAELLPDAEAADRLGPLVAGLLSDPVKRENMARAAGEMGLRDSDTKIVDCIDSIVSSQNQSEK